MISYALYGGMNMSISDLISLLSGIAMFLFGMTLMGDGLKATSGNKLEPVLFKLTGTPIRGLAAV